MTTIMTTFEEDSVALNQVIDEIKIAKKRGRVPIKRTHEELLALRRERYRDNAVNNVEKAKAYYVANKEQLAIKRHERYIRDKSALLLA